MHFLEFDAAEFDPICPHPVFRRDQAVGVVTSVSYGHRIQKTVGLAYFRQPVGTSDAFEAGILGREVGARITAPLSI